jgi:hypothetical protein
VPHSRIASFRKRFGAPGASKIFQISIALHEGAAEEKTVNIDSPVQEKAIVYPAKGKSAIKMTNRLGKFTKQSGIKRHRSGSKGVKELLFKLRFWSHKKRSIVKNAVKRLGTRAGD